MRLNRSKTCGVALIVWMLIALGCGKEQATRLNHQEVEVGCGVCQFGMEGDDCELAIRVDGRSYWVDGTDIDDHGDAHAEDGFCNATRGARVTGEIHGDRIQVSEFELL